MNSLLVMIPFQSPQTPSKITAEKGLPALPWYIEFYSTNTRWGRRIARGWWAWEIVCAITSCSATIVLIALLRSTDGHSQQNWYIGNAQITLSALVAAISTIIRATLLLVVAGALNQSMWNRFAEAQPLKDLETFGEAGANSLNSLRLLWRTKARHLAALGALLTILSLAFDVFVQQVLQLRIQSVFTTFQANLSAADILPRTEIYTSDQALWGTNITSWDTPTDLDMKAFILANFLNTNVSVPSAQCSSGNCTWPTTPTWAVCSSCIDATHRLNRTINGPNITYQLPHSLSGGPKLSLNLDRGELSTFTDIFTYESSGELTEPLDIGVTFRANILEFYSVGLTPVTFPKLEEYLQYGQESLTPEVLDTLVLGYNCTLYLCVQAYAAKMTNGKMEQWQVGDSWDQMAEGVRASADPLRGQYMDLSPVNVPSELSVTNSSTFSFEEEGRFELSSLISIFSGGFAIDVPNLSGNDSGSSQQGETTSRIIAEVFYSTSNTSTTMNTLPSNLAAALSMYLRTQHRAAPDSRYAATVETRELVIQVIWTWLIYPIVLVIGAVIFLCLTVVQTRRCRIGAWKGSRIALLLTATDASVHNAIHGGWRHRRGLVDRVGDIRVSLKSDKNNMAFIRPRSNSLGSQHLQYG